MANIYKQSVSQENNNVIGIDTPKRLIVQYYDDVAEENKQLIVNYDDLTTSEKATFDAYQALCESKMV